MKTTIFFIIFGLLASISFSQDTHFSMFYKAPIMLNPANTGNFEGKFRIISNYRKQGDFSTNPYSTNVFSFDAPIFYFNRLGSIGITILNDRTANRTLNTSELLVTTAHFIKISKYSYLHMGFGFAAVNKYIDQDYLTFPNQFDNSIGSFNPNLDNKEPFDSYNKWYADLSWGLMWSMITPEIKCQIGIAMFHYNKPTLDFISLNYKINPKYQTHLYLEKTFSNSIYIKPKFLYNYQNKASEMLIGSDVGIKFDTDFFKNIYIGSYFRGGINRISDAITINTGLSYKHFNFNFSYDYSVNLLNNDTSFEVAIFYILPRLEVDKRAIQCEIF